MAGVMAAAVADKAKARTTAGMRFMMRFMAFLL
jgi:hypothetical protein